ncbi:MULTISPECIES: C40 family peptidase [Paenibacillus]|uniref:Hydrolase Nlp/P60 n=2 Tax=Paenibacillus TaxID=44249 RepID=A0A1V4HCC0_9BACL|nr:MULTISPECIES: C40 family peptidase [Paenibacillus]MEC0230361.1 C40 family peptidase [Paenibacillus alba]NQX69218.1 C40 family peptidase [Paenibacillus alba]OPH49007.1 hydrolase Nlp/P60 [Paenibacillus ferrarius]
MKKIVALVFSLVLFLSVALGSVSASQAKLDETVDGLLGIPYKDAGTTTKGFDCSGFTRYVFDQFGIDLPHSSSAQDKEGFWVDKSDLRKGDLVFFNTGGKGISHVGIYLGNGEFIHSASDEGIVKNKLSESYYAKRYVSARRVLWDDIYNQLTAESK